MNYDLLRPFDLEAAKRGDLLTDVCGNEYTFVAESGPDGDHAIRQKSDGNVFVDRASALRMAPLAWVEGKPVYPGDVLWYKTNNFSMMVVERNPYTKTGLKGVVKEALPGSVFSGGETTWAEPKSWTWERPKVPLCEVEGKPVYPGDVLYQNTPSLPGERIVVSGNEDGVFDDQGRWNGRLHLTWTPPKQKKEMWVNVYPEGEGFGYPTKEKADQVASSDRIACVRLEYEV